MSLVIDIRDKRLPGPSRRLTLVAGTDSPAERAERAASVRKLLDQGDDGARIIAALRARELTVEEVHHAVARLDLAALLQRARPEPSTNGSGPAPAGLGLGDLIDRFLLSLAGRTESEKTREGYAVICGQIEAEFGVERNEDGGVTTEVPIPSITTRAVERFLHGPKETLNGRPWAARTQQRVHAVAAQIWDLALAEDEEHAERTGADRQLTRNLWRKQGHRKGVRAQKVRLTRIEFLSRSEAARLLWRVRGTPFAAWIAAGIYAGLRGGETRHLRREIDVDVRKGVLHIQPRKGAHPWRPKGDRSVRDVPVNRRLARWIRLHIAEGYAGEVYLFHPFYADRPIERSAVTGWTREAFTSAGIQYGRKKDALTYHSLRHTFASWLTMKNVHPKKIAALMGARVEVVLETYSHLIDNDLRIAVEEL